MKNITASVYTYGLFSLIMLSLIVSSSAEKRRVDCTKFPFAKPCRGISAKRDVPFVPKFVPTQSNLDVDLRNLPDLESLILRSYNANSDDSPLKEKPSLLKLIERRPFMETEMRNRKRTEYDPTFNRAYQPEPGYLYA